MLDACKRVKDKLKESNHPDGLIIQSDYFGPLFQYSHGLSVYFPWAPPVQDNPPLPGDDILLRYSNYKFTTDLKTSSSEDHSWLSFLNSYFEETRRVKRAKEDNPKLEENGERIVPAYLAAMTGSGNISREALEDRKPSGQLQKPSGQLFDEGCDCSVKNYPMDFFIRSERAGGDPNARTNGSSRPQTATAAGTG
jgi:hypothetical protein